MQADLSERARSGVNVCMRSVKTVDLKRGEVLALACSGGRHTMFSFRRAPACDFLAVPLNFVGLSTAVTVCRKC